MSAHTAESTRALQCVCVCAQLSFHLSNSEPTQRLDRALDLVVAFVCVYRRRSSSTFSRQWTAERLHVVLFVCNKDCGLSTSFLRVDSRWEANAARSAGRGARSLRQRPLPTYILERQWAWSLSSTSLKLYSYINLNEENNNNNLWKVIYKVYTKRALYIFTDNYNCCYRCLELQGNLLSQVTWSALFKHTVCHFCCKKVTTEEAVWCPEVAWDHWSCCLLS